jgi:hypothetical protein
MRSTRRSIRAMIVAILILYILLFIFVSLAFSGVIYKLQLKTDVNSGTSLEGVPKKSQTENYQNQNLKVKIRPAFFCFYSRFLRTRIVETSNFKDQNL